MSIPQDIMAWANRAYERDPARVIVGKRTPRELLAIVRELADLEEVIPATNQIPRSMLDGYEEAIRENCRAAGETIPGPVELHVYRLLPTEKNEPYRDRSDPICICLDRTTGWFLANSEPLMVRLILQAGLDRNHLDARDEHFLHYITTAFRDDPENPLYRTNPQAEGSEGVVEVPIEVG